MFNVYAGVCMFEICVGVNEISAAHFAVRTIYLTWLGATLVDIVFHMSMCVGAWLLSHSLALRTLKFVGSLETQKIVYHMLQWFELLISVLICRNIVGVASDMHNLMFSCGSHMPCAIGQAHLFFCECLRSRSSSSSAT